VRTRLWSVLILYPFGVAAQRAPSVQASAHAGALAEQRAAAWDAAPRAAVDLRLERPWLSLQGIGSAARGARTDWRLIGEGSAALRSPSLGGWSAALVGERRAVTLDDAADAASLHALTATIGRSRGRVGLWAGTTVARVDPGHPRTVGDSAGAVPFPGRAAVTHTVGAWRQLGGTVVSLSVSGHAAPTTLLGAAMGDTLIEHRVLTDTGYVSWWEPAPARPDRRRRWAETQLRVAWAGERVALDALLGARPAIGTLHPASAWAELGGALRVRPSLWLAGSAGVAPSRPDLGISHRRFVRLGVQLAPVARTRATRELETRPIALAASLDPTGEGSYLFTLRVPHARIVELSGDVTGWKPVTLVQVAPDRWETALRLTPGTYRVSIRIDGDRWTAPPGTASVDDDFGGSAGLLVAR